MFIPCTQLWSALIPSRRSCCTLARACDGLESANDCCHRCRKTRFFGSGGNVRLRREAIARTGFPSAVCHQRTAPRVPITGRRLRFHTGPGCWRTARCSSCWQCRSRRRFHRSGDTPRRCWIHCTRFHRNKRWGESSRNRCTVLRVGCNRCCRLTAPAGRSSRMRSRGDQMPNTIPAGPCRSCSDSGP